MLRDIVIECKKGIKIKGQITRKIDREREATEREKGKKTESLTLPETRKST